MTFYVVHIVDGELRAFKRCRSIRATIRTARNYRRLPGRVEVMRSWKWGR